MMGFFNFFNQPKFDYVSKQDRVGTNEKLHREMLSKYKGEYIGGIVVMLIFFGLFTFLFVGTLFSGELMGVLFMGGFLVLFALIFVFSLNASKKKKDAIANYAYEVYIVTCLDKRVHRSKNSRSYYCSYKFNGVDMEDRISSRDYRNIQIGADVLLIHFNDTKLQGDIYSL